MFSFFLIYFLRNIGLYGLKRFFFCFSLLFPTFSVFINNLTCQRTGISLKNYRYILANENYTKFASLIGIYYKCYLNLKSTILSMRKWNFILCTILYLISIYKLCCEINVLNKIFQISTERCSKHFSNIFQKLLFILHIVSKKLQFSANNHFPVYKTHPEIQFRFNTLLRKRTLNPKLYIKKTLWSKNKTFTWLKS